MTDLTTALSIATMNPSATTKPSHDLPRDAAAGKPYPGPPRLVFRVSSWSAALWALALGAALLVAQAMTCDFLEKRTVDVPSRHWIFQAPLLETRAAVTMLMGFLALAIGRAQLALGLRPYLSYINTNPTKEESQQNRKYCRVHVRNDGTGPAIIRHVSYILRTPGNEWRHYHQHEDVVARLDAEFHLKLGVDYQLPRFSVGTALGKDKQLIVFELLDRLVGEFTELDAFDINFQYDGLLGDLYEKTIHCIPRPSYIRPGAP